MKKKCSSCGNLLEVNSDNFHKDKYQKDGFTGNCKTCRLALKKKYDSSNKELVLEKARKYYYDNIYKLQQQSLNYYYSNIEACQVRNKIWCVNNIEERKEHRRRSNSKRRAILRNNYSEQISKSELSELISQYPNCPYCNCVLNKNNTQIDHVYPLSKGGYHIIDNLMPCCENCNNRKQNKLPLDWILKICQK